MLKKEVRSKMSVEAKLKDITVSTFAKKKNSGEKITMLTAYDYSTAKYFDEAGVDSILVGDSVGMVVLGYDSTIHVTMEDMVTFTSAVTRGAKRCLVVADMPFMSYHASVEEAVKNAGMLMRSGASAVKLEGATDHILNVVKRCVESGIPVVGHLGFTPQYLNVLGGYKIQAKSAQKTEFILQQALKLQEAGAFCVVLEMVPEESAKYITENLNIPTIGIGAGRYTDGQVLVADDILGKYSDFKPKFARKYANLNSIIKEAASNYISDVNNGTFPSEDEVFHLDEASCNELRFLREAEKSELSCNK